VAVATAAVLGERVLTLAARVAHHGNEALHADAEAGYGALPSLAANTPLATKGKRLYTLMRKRGPVLIHL
jgi:hypothetical protein